MQLLKAFESTIIAMLANRPKSVAHLPIVQACFFDVLLIYFKVAFLKNKFQLVVQFIKSVLVMRKLVNVNVITLNDGTLLAAGAKNESGTLHMAPAMDGTRMERTADATTHMTWPVLLVCSCTTNGIGRMPALWTKLLACPTLPQTTDGGIIETEGVGGVCASTTSAANIKPPNKNRERIFAPQIMASPTPAMQSART